MFLEIVTLVIGLSLVRKALSALLGLAETSDVDDESPAYGVYVVGVIVLTLSLVLLILARTVGRVFDSDGEATDQPNHDQTTINLGND